MRFELILDELKNHVPFTFFATVSGLMALVGLYYLEVPAAQVLSLYYTFHPFHVLVSALATAGMYRLHTNGHWLSTLLIGTSGALIIATSSDALVPFLGEYWLDLPARELHLGFVEKPLRVVGLAVLGSGIGWYWPRTRFPHAGHVMLSTFSSLLHMTMAIQGGLAPAQVVKIGVFLFLAVWVPCCASDIVFPLCFADPESHEKHGCG